MDERAFSDRAVALFQSGYNCAEAMLRAAAEELGRDPNTVSSLATGLGGGVGRTGNLCGALTGGVLALGLAVGRESPTDTDRKEVAYAQARLLEARFEAAHGTLNCRELIGLDLTTHAGLERAHQEDRFRKVCDPIVRETALILWQLLGEVRASRPG